MKVSREVFGQLAEIILEGGAIRATKYLSPQLTVKATRRRYKKKINRREQSINIHFTVGRPNYAERKFIKTQSKFPVRDIQIRWP